MSESQLETSRKHYALLVRITTRWSDYDMLGHLNNVEYYRYFESAVLTLLRETGLDWQSDPVIPFAVENGCRFLQPVAVSGHVDVGVRITKLGNSSVRYEVAIFMPTQDTPSAEGFFVHVFVNRKIGRPTPLPEPVRLHFAQQIDALTRGESRRVEHAQLLPTTPSADA